MGVRPLLLQELGDAHRTEQVHFDGGVEGRVEADGGRRVHDNVGRREQAAVFVVEAETVDGDIAADDAHTPLGLSVEALAQLGAQPVEAVVAKDLAAGPVGGRRPSPRPDEEHQLAVRH